MKQLSDLNGSEEDRVVQLEDKVKKLEGDLKVVVAALEKYVKDSAQQKEAIGVIVREAIAVKDDVSQLKTDGTRVQEVMNDHHVRLDHLEHDVNNESQLHSWMKEESAQEAYDERITGNDIARGQKNYDDERLRFGMRRFGH